MVHGTTEVLPLKDFLPAVRAAIPRFATQAGRGPAPDSQQEACIVHAPTTALQIVAGPGSGKTTVLVLRALRHVLVDGIMPEHVVLTTFTTKAADEIRTRLIEWGQQVVAHLQPIAAPELSQHLAQVDVNRFVTGTLDSICEDALRTYRAATDSSPVLLEGFAANALMHRKGLNGTVYTGSAGIDAGVAAYLARFSFDGKTPPGNVGELRKAVRPLFDRFAHDAVDLTAFRNLTGHGQARGLLADAYDGYTTYLRNSNRLDFAVLEQRFLERLKGGRLTRLVGTIQAFLVDEYQDTNPLQEEIYFELVRASRPFLTVVGDDDQSLYRFRGATVELFRDFATRLAQHVPGVAAQRLDLVNNYRSTPEIVAFFNGFIGNDPDFSAARVSPPKPLIQHRLPSKGLRAIGMFRPNPETLALDLATFLNDVFRRNGRSVAGPNGPVTISRAPNGGDLGDAVLLAHSVNEFSPPFRGNPARPRFPRLLRDELDSVGLRVFNPRGEALRDVLDVQRLLGAMLECLDPTPLSGGPPAIQSSQRLRGTAIQYLNTFRAAYAQYASTDPHPNRPHGIAAFVADWGSRASTASWPKEWPILELCFTLLAWFPTLHDDPEGQVHLEAIARGIAQSAGFSPYRALVLNGAGVHDERSVASAYRDIFQPLAEGDIDVDEEVLPHIPRDRLALMTIHQAKGLEFPLVIADVGSRFGMNHRQTRFQRFPSDASGVAILEDDLAGACAVGALRNRRAAIQRTFEDLIRLYYVAFSRAQTVLLLIGLDPAIQYQTKVQNVATWWRRDGSWPWITQPGRRKPPPMADAIPLELI